MKPSRFIVAQDPSPNARHCDVAPVLCQADLVMRFTPSARPGEEYLLCIRCPRCDADALAKDHMAPAVQVYGVRFPEHVAWADEDDEDEGPYGV